MQNLQVDIVAAATAAAAAIMSIFAMVYGVHSLHFTYVSTSIIVVSLARTLDEHECIIAITVN